jgi:choline dehydrogenase-like flavoprotein
MLNATVSLQNIVPGQEAKSTFQFFTPEVLEAFRLARAGDTAAVKTLQRVFGAFAPAAAGTRLFDLKTRQEQAPNPRSRVLIARERDALGVPRVQLDWQLTELDRQSFRAFNDALGKELGRSGVGRARVQSWVTAKTKEWPETISGGWHHMGTTRMHRDPKQGVVDVNCRVHGLANLYVAGASVFPTAGCANPTLTLVAMTLRLSDHLKTNVA